MYKDLETFHPVSIRTPGSSVQEADELTPYATPPELVLFVNIFLFRVYL
jgi:hypothetical protein